MIIMNILVITIAIATTPSTIITIAAVVASSTTIIIVTAIRNRGLIAIGGL